MSQSDESMREKHIYEDKYYDYLDVGSFKSAKEVIPALLSHFNHVKSVLDVGCGRGAWLKTWVDNGVEDIAGFDGPYIVQDKLPFDSSKFYPVDLRKSVNINRKFDLVTSFEIAEHIDEDFADVYVDNITQHGDLIAFSAAVPGQGGEDHVNEQPPEYWIKKFEARGYKAYDIIRRELINNKNIEPWYKFNMMILSKTSLEAPSYPDKTLAIPLSWRLRCTVLSVFPEIAITKMAKIKHAATRSVTK